MNHKDIAKQIYDNAEKEKIDVRPLIREWIMVCEKIGIEGFNRDKFLDECCIESDRRRLRSEDDICR